MELCFFCEKIKEIREKQGKDYLADLCEDCKKKTSGRNSELNNFY